MNRKQINQLAINLLRWVDLDPEPEGRPVSQAWRGFIEIIEKALEEAEEGE